jgi:uncharacterized membrane protein (UPF0127 family)
MRLLIPLFGLAVLLSACSFSPMGGGDDAQKIALVGPEDEAISVVVEIVDDAASRAEGLMGRQSLDSNEGMLFMFSSAQPLTFWMKNTLIPLDIIFFDAQGNVIGSDTMVPCTADPCLRYTSSGPANIALEVNAGFVETHGIGAGWRIALPVQ